jgi:hypothetical protein
MSPSLGKFLGEDYYIMRHVWHMEYVVDACRAASAAAGREIATATYIFDLAGMKSPKSGSMALFNITNEMDQRCYPELLHVAFIINSPWIFKGIWAIIAPFLHPVTRQKVGVLLCSSMRCCSLHRSALLASAVLYSVLHCSVLHSSVLLYAALVCVLPCRWHHTGAVPFPSCCRCGDAAH